MNPLFLVEQCYNRLPPSWKSEPWKATEHGRKVLQNEDELNAYIAAYGEMHIVKCKAALQNFPFDNLDLYAYNIYDWGCGQGLATITLLDMLHDRGKLSHLRKIYLIEPSAIALERAKKWTSQFTGPGVEIISVNKFIPNADSDALNEVSCSSAISINLFSNILDLRSISLSWLARKTASLATVNYMVCIGPKFVQNTNTRIMDFCGYFQPQEYFSNIDKYPYSYTSRTHHAYGCETKCFIHKRDTTIYSNCIEYADETYDFDPYDFIPDLDSKDAALCLYNKLRHFCSSSFDVFLRPCINCDTVDVIVMSKSQGIVLINTCNDIEEMESSLSKVEHIKDNLFNVHLRTLKIDSVTYKSVFYCVKTALYFPKYSSEEVKNAIDALNKKKNEEKRKKIGVTWQNKYFYNNSYCLTDSTDLHSFFETLSVSGFKYEYYEELIKLISDQWHSYKDGDTNLNLSLKQKAIVNSNNKKIKVQGVAGCGKTQVVAHRAVAQHLKTGDRVLIITFNITLIQYIKMRISQVPADFSPNMFEIINYHQFFKSKTNQYLNKYTPLIDYDNPHIFDDCKDRIKKYKTIIIDEVQDFKTSWIQLIIKNFLAEQGTVSIFGDGNQNIYDRDMDNKTKMPSLSECGFPGGSWPEMSERVSMRILNPSIASLSSNFAHTFLSNYSDILSTQQELQFDEYHIKYWNLNENTPADMLASNIAWILQNFNIEARDTVVMGQSINFLRRIEEEYVSITKSNTMINFETSMQHQSVLKNSNPNYINNDLNNIRRAAKTHFTTACDSIKISTIHSFKGWESKSVILFLQPKMHTDDVFEDSLTQENENTHALVYTALTRAKCNLFVLNLNNREYDKFFSQYITT